MANYARVGRFGLQNICRKTFRCSSAQSLSYLKLEWMSSNVSGERIQNVSKFIKYNT